MGEDALHLANLADNLQLVADLGYGDVALVTPEPGSGLVVRADARPVTAVTAVPVSRVGMALDPAEETEAYEAFETGRVVSGGRRRVTRGITFSTIAYPVGRDGVTDAVLVRHVSHQVEEAPGTMERAFMEAADQLIAILRERDLFDVNGFEPFVTVRRAGDGLLRIDAEGRVEYASPNAVNIMRGAGAEGSLVATAASSLPGSAIAVAPVLHAGGCLHAEVEVSGRVLNYRTMSLIRGAVVLVEDVTEARGREQELKVKEATIREVHHRVKNNLQTIASLLRIQSRRSDNDETRCALLEAVERISSMAVVHEMLAAATDENVDFAEVARTVVDMVRQSFVGSDAAVSVDVEGDSGDVPATVATSLALVMAELVHNAIEHGLGSHMEGRVTIAIRRLPAELHLVVRDDGAGLPEDFSLTTSANLGLAIVRTVVQDDLDGTLAFGGGRGTTVTIRIPMDDEGE